MQLKQNQSNRHHSPRQPPVSVALDLLLDCGEKRKIYKSNNLEFCLWD